MDEPKLLACVNVALNTFAIFFTALVVPAVYNQANDLKAEIMSDMRQFKVIGR